MIESQDPLVLLQSMQQASLKHSPGLPEEVQAVEYWSGVGFKVGNIHLVSPLDQVIEVIQIPPMTPVPRTKKWLKGIANVRGNLVTLIDMPEFFGKEPVRFGEKSRVMVLSLEGFTTGLIVNEVFGLRHFDEETEKQNIQGLDDPVMAYATGAFLRDDTLWGVFDMNAFSENEDFRMVSI